MYLVLGTLPFSDSALRVCGHLQPLAAAANGARIVPGSHERVTVNMGLHRRPRNGGAE